MLQQLSVVLMAAGRGIRFGALKQFEMIAGETLVKRSVKLFSDFEEVKDIFVVYPHDMSEEEARKSTALDDYNTVRFVKGGSLREDSAKNGIECVSTEYVMIHDAVRPFLDKDLIATLISVLESKGNAVPVIRPDSTVKYDNDGKVESLDREKVMLVQTPQAYITKDILNAYNKKRDSGYTDSSTLALEAGLVINFVEGSRTNIKITRPEDILISAKEMQ